MNKRSLFLFTLMAFVMVTNSQSPVGSQSIPKWKIEDVVRSFTNKSDTVYVVNFWATFCKPCIEEIPDFIRIVKKYEGQKVKLLLVSLDMPSFYPAKLSAFVKKNNYKTNHVWLNETDADRFCPMIDEKWSGAIPSTIIVNGKTGYRKFTEDQISPADFEAALKEAIGGNALNKYYSPMIDAEVIDKASVQRKNYATDMEFITFKATDSAVYAIMSGKVNMVVKMEGFKVMIIEKDGLYYTYSNLGSTIIKKGDEIKRGQLIGYAA